MNDIAGTTIPLSLIVAIGTGLCSAVVYVFKQLIASHERRATELIEQMKADRAQAEEQREEYTKHLEDLVRQVTDEHDKTRTEMIATLSTNSEVVRQNTLARELSNKQISQLTPEITAVVVLKLVELGFIQGPLKSAVPTTDLQ